MNFPTIIVGGICLTGKTTLIKRLTSRGGFDFKYIEGDDLHTKESIESMTFGRPLTDADRRIWKAKIGDIIRNREEGPVSIISCSALTRAFRDELRSYGEVRFIFLVFSRASAEKRAIKRLRDDWERLQREPSYRPHYFQPAIYPELLDGQYRDLQVPGGKNTPGEPEGDCFVVDLDQFPSGDSGPETDYASLAGQIADWLQVRKP
ncbi:hypothetical protein G0Q06_13225 [Puniceicoccales bacterium CK1056]|uniref:gluconokinase n=1 Tax=Oceanipulchritudo coccoides TaxID=2706888 RepID=A0A6B2M332_9BACT|nr:hypothetical protein [Oceanipulchritudo coccoides]NDV63421.1 hypothetical protein [Oceanipulchritudo coccoides]